MDESVRHRLTATLSERVYGVLRAEFHAREPEEAYALLFPIGVDFRTNRGDGIAAQLLVGLEQRCPVSCEEALMAVVAPPRPGSRAGQAWGLRSLRRLCR